MAEKGKVTGEKHDSGKFPGNIQRKGCRQRSYIVLGRRAGVYLFPTLISDTFGEAKEQKGIRIAVRERKETKGALP